MEIFIPLNKLEIPDEYESYFIDAVYQKMIDEAWSRSPESIDHYHLMDKNHILWEYRVHVFGYESGFYPLEDRFASTTLNVGDGYQNMIRRYLFGEE